MKPLSLNLAHSPRLLRFSAYKGSSQRPSPAKPRGLQVVFPPHAMDQIKRGLTGMAVALGAVALSQSIESDALTQAGIVTASWAKYDTATGVWRKVFERIFPG